MCSIKKHVSQMSTEEFEVLMSRAKNIKSWNVSEHLIHRMDERGGNRDIVLEVLGKGELIEFHQRNGKARILIRGKKDYGGSVACVVFQFTGKKIITIYWNNKDDHHTTLREEAYDSKVDILNLLKEEEIRMQERGG